MGGAFVGLADDWSAAFWNPAGLAFQHGWGLGESVDLISLRAFDGNSVANPAPPLTRSNIEQGDPFFQFGGEPAHFNTTDTTIQAALPSVVGYKIWDNWAFSAGVFSPLGFAFNVEDHSIPGYSALYNNQGYVVEYNLSLARQWDQRWAIGLGLNWIDARETRASTKETPDYTFHSTADGRGQALQGVLGLMVHLTEKTSFGAAYKTGQHITLDGAATVTSTEFPLTLPGVGTLNNEASAQHSDFYNPPTYTAGFAFHPVAPLTLTTDWEGTDWKGTRVDFNFDQQGNILQDQNFNAGWRFTNRARFGGEYRLPYSSDNQWALRWGYTWDPYAVPDSAVSMTNLVDVSRNVYTLGLGWHYGKWEPAIGFAYATGSRTAEGVDYKKVDRLLSIGLTYRT